MVYTFNGNNSHTLGVEIELQIVDAKTLSLSNSVHQIIDQVPEKWTNKIKTELMQCYCEINTDVCESIKQVEPDLTEKLNWAQKTANELGLQFIWGGTHPFSAWQEQKYSKGDRYAWLTKAMRDVSRRAVVFGLHVHVGVDTGDKAIQLCDRLLRHIPTLLAISANSPMFNGRDTGLASYRSNILDSLPTTGLPAHMRNWSEYVWLVDHLRSTGFIKSIREIWWDVRPHHEFGTVEIRIMDMPLNMKHMLGLVAITQCLVAAISERIDNGAYLYDCHPMIAKQNKWHAARYGMDAMFVDPETMQAVPARQTVRRLMQRCLPFAKQLNCEEELFGLHDILENGTGARLQREVFEKTHNMYEVIHFLTQQGSNMA